VRPTVRDITNVRHLLQIFGKATGLMTNIQKSELYHIRCEGINQTDLNDAFQGRVAEFPCKYLGLPLHIGRTRRADEQILIDKIGGRLPGWKGRLLNRAGRLTLVNSVLSSIPVYHMTSFPLSKWAIKRIDRIRRNFLWKGADDARKGTCLVNWRRVNRAKSLGGLGVKDLTCFNRALRLRWEWLHWAEPSRPWTGMSISMAAEEEELFKACTVISIGNGVRTNFWKDRWLKGQAPKDIAPECFRWAWRKNITVAKALTNRCWMRGLRRMNNETALRQFVELWTQIQQIRLSSHPDQITWRFTSDGQYIVKSAYEMQFCGSYADHIWKKIWGAKAENKCRFFCWLMLQDRLPTADRIIRRGGQTNHICQLCHIREESILHMIATCSFSKSVWTKIAMDYSLQPLQDPGHMTLRSWRQSWVDRGRAESNKHLQVLIYTVWNLWKERCRRVFDNKAMSQVQLTAIIKSDITNYSLAHRNDEV